QARGRPPSLRQQVRLRPQRQGTGPRQPGEVSRSEEHPCSLGTGVRQSACASMRCVQCVRFSLAQTNTELGRSGGRGWMRRRLRKKRHRELLTTVCAYVVTEDANLRERLLQSEPGTPFPINKDCATSMLDLIRGNGLRYWVTVARKLAPATAVVV